MAANTIITSIVTGGTNSHTTTVEEANFIATDFATNGVVGAITLNSGSGGTGAFCVNADASPDMGVTIKAGSAYITATPSSQNSQILRARAAADYTAYTINANTSGSTKYDWIYIKVDATKANNPASDASDVSSIYTSRSSSNSTDNGTPPTYGLLLAIVTVANAAASITNANITDKRYNASLGAQNGSLIVQQNGTGTDAVIQAAGIDANIALDINSKGTGAIKFTAGSSGITGVIESVKNPYKFSVYRNASLTSSSSLTVVAHDTKLFDTGTNVDVVTNKGRFTAPIAGFYLFSARAANTAAINTQMMCALFKNGSNVLSGVAVDPSQVSGGENSVMVTGILQLAANDYVEHAFVGGGGSTMSVGSLVCWFHGMLISAL